MKQIRIAGTVFAAITIIAVGLLIAAPKSVFWIAALLLGLGAAVFLCYLWLVSPKRYDLPLRQLSQNQPVSRCPNELVPLQKLLSAHREQLAYRVRDMKILNAYISHEMKNSLNILAAKVQTGETAQELTTSIKRIAVTIGDILILSEVKREGGQETTDLAMVCAQAIDDYRKTKPDIFFNMPPEGVRDVPGREHLYYRAVSNLLDNAVKYGEHRPILLKLSEAHGCVVLTVKNTGEQLKAEHYDRLFDSNYRFSTLKSNSHGIGLSLVKNVAELHGGAVWAENGPDGSTLFYLSIPVEGGAAQ